MTKEIQLEVLNLPEFGYIEKLQFFERFVIICSSFHLNKKEQNEKQYLWETSLRQKFRECALRGTSPTFKFGSRWVWFYYL